MTDPGLLRFLELVERELGAADARIELGGKDPDDPRIVWRPSPSGARVVAVFAEPPADRAVLETRLEALLGPFFGAVEQTISGVASSRTPPDIAGKRLDDELSRLADRAVAAGAVVFDMASPVVWGASQVAAPRVSNLLEDAILKLRDNREALRPGHTSRLPAGDGVEALARPFAGLYVIALIFEGALSEPTALGAILHAMPIIERLVLALPPVDPSPSGGKVVRMPVRLR